MDDSLGNALVQFQRSLRALRAAAGAIPALNDALFEGFEDWERQLTLKLAPQLSGEGCLIVAVAGGTNTGKSTVFNALLGEGLSPVSPYGAYTKHPLVAANERRHRECLEKGKLLPDAFVPKPWGPDQAAALTDESADGMTVFIARHDALPDRLVLLDTPDVDSIVKENWELAKSIREAGDVVVAVLTAQKYADTRVVEFLREARQAGRHVVALMNMADDGGQGYAVTRQQLAEFFEYLRGSDGAAPPIELPVFVMPRLTGDPREVLPLPVAIDDPGRTLWAYLEALDAVGLKKRVLADNLSRFTAQADAFIARAEAVSGGLGEGLAQLDAMRVEASGAYVPKPGREVVTVVHDYIQEHAKGADRALGQLSANVAKVPGWLLTKTKAVFRRDRGVSASEHERRLEDKQRKAIEEIVHRLYGQYSTQAVSAMRERVPQAADHFADRLKDLDPASVAAQVVEETLESDAYVSAYRDYAYRELEVRWTDWKFRWKVRSFYNLGLLGSGAGVLILLWSGGWAQGLVLSEILVSMGVPVLEHTVARTAAYLWGDKLSGLVGAWQRLQRDALEKALRNHLTEPALGELRPLHAALDPGLGKMKELIELCRNST